LYSSGNGPYSPNIHPDSQALVESIGNLEDEDSIRMAIWFDNEEVGSESAHGAMSTLVSSSIERILRSMEIFVHFIFAYVYSVSN
jgi:aspartyl aminopeptidase